MLFPISVTISAPSAGVLSTDTPPLLCVSGNYVLNYLATRPKLATFVTQALIQLYARITKLGWFDCQKDEYVFRNVITDVTRFLQVRYFERWIHTLWDLKVRAFSVIVLHLSVICPVFHLCISWLNSDYQSEAAHNWQDGSVFYNLKFGRAGIHFWKLLPLVFNGKTSLVVFQLRNSSFKLSSLNTPCWLVQNGKHVGVLSTREIRAVLDLLAVTARAI